MEYTTSTRCAQHVMEDDRFKMGGQMYRIADTSPNLYNEVIIWAYPVEDSTETTTLIVPKKTLFKIYNLK